LSLEISLLPPRYREDIERAARHRAETIVERAIARLRDSDARFLPLSSDALAQIIFAERPLSCPPVLLNLDGQLRNVTQSNGDCCANSPASARNISTISSFQDKNYLASGLRIINAEKCRRFLTLLGPIVNSIARFDAGFEPRRNREESIS
jgi:hypothetical protein